jgi:hypothetical protein
MKNPSGIRSRNLRKRAKRGDPEAITLLKERREWRVKAREGRPRRKRTDATRKQLPGSFESRQR